MFGNMSIAQQIELSGDATQVTLDLIPGTEYSVRLRAENPSGMVITDAITIETLAGRKFYMLYDQVCMQMWFNLVHQLYGFICMSNFSLKSIRFAVSCTCRMRWIHIYYSIIII